MKTLTLRLTLVASAILCVASFIFLFSPNFNEVIEALTFVQILGPEDLFSHFGTAIVCFSFFISISFSIRFFLKATGKIVDGRTDKNIDDGCFIRMQNAGIAIFIFTFVTLGVTGSIIGIASLIILTIMGYIEEVVGNKRVSFA